MCDLRQHAVGQRVRWQRYDRDGAPGERWYWVKGEVIAHRDHSVTIRTDDGDELSSPCVNVSSAT